jgi:anti-sigma factor RsiW
MRCSKARKFFSSYIDGELGENETSRLKSHLARCGRCSTELDEMRMLHGLFSRAERFSAPPGFCGDVMQKISARPVKVFSLFPAFTRFAEAAAVVAAVTAGLMTGGMLINVVAPHQMEEQIAASLSLETLEALPPDSLGRAYLAMTEERR